MEDIDIKKLIELAQSKPSTMPSEDAIKQLIRAATTPEEPELYDPRALHANAFIERYMRPGSQSVAGQTLYKLFRKMYITELSRPLFYMYLKKQYKSSITHGIIYFKLDPTALGLVPEYSMYKDPRILRKSKSRGKKQKQHKK